VKDGGKGDLSNIYGQLKKRKLQLENLKKVVNLEYVGLDSA